MEAPPGFEPGMEVLQTSALPLGDGADSEGFPAGVEHGIVPNGHAWIKRAPASKDRVVVSRGRLWYDDDFYRRAGITQW